MPAQRGPFKGNAFRYKVVKAIQSLEGREFGSRDIQALTNLSRESITSFLYRLTLRKSINRLRMGVYVQINDIKTNSPSGFIVEATWNILDKNREAWLSLADVVAETENEFSKMDKLFDTENPVDLYHNIAVIITIWYQNGHLQRTGQRKSYLYQLMPHVHTRPVTRQKTKTPQPVV